ncbi:hypothetical protein CR513_52196, partial [Mucuna pruriens]
MITSQLIFNENKCVMINERVKNHIFCDLVFSILSKVPLKYLKQFRWVTLFVSAKGLKKCCETLLMGNFKVIPTSPMKFLLYENVVETVALNDCELNVEDKPMKLDVDMPSCYINDASVQTLNSIKWVYCFVVNVKELLIKLFIIRPLPCIEHLIGVGERSYQGSLVV